MLQQLQPHRRIHVDEIDDDHATDVAQLQLAGDLDRAHIGPCTVSRALADRVNEPEFTSITVSASVGSIIT